MACFMVCTMYFYSRCIAQHNHRRGENTGEGAYGLHPVPPREPIPTEGERDVSSL